MKGIADFAVSFFIAEKVTMPKIAIKCKYCDKKFYDYASANRKVCSRACNVKLNNPGSSPKRRLPEQQCKYCRKMFYSRKRQKFCNLTCSSLAQRKRLLNECAWCKSTYETYECWNTKYCSKKCLAEYQKTLVGPLNKQYKGKISENRAFRSRAEYKKWRKAVFERDNYTCQFCGERGGKLNADHILPFAVFPDLRLDIDNGRTLCVPCHRTTDTYGIKAITKYKETINVN